MPRKRKLDDQGYPADKAIIDELAATASNLDRVKADFLRVDVATALTFSGIALQTDDSVKKQRNQLAARKAYDSVLRLAKKAKLTDDDVRTLSGDLKRLKSELLALGEVF